MIRLGKKEGWDISLTGFSPEDAGLTLDQAVLFDQILAVKTTQEKGRTIVSFILIYNGNTELDLTEYNNTPIGTEIRTPNLPGVFCYYHHKRSTPTPLASDWTTKLDELKGVVLQKGSNILSFTTIQAALDNAESGDIIKLEAKTYNEDVVITKDNIKIFGTDKEKTIINKLTFTGKNNYVKEVFVSGDLTFLCTQDYEARMANQLRDSIINGNVYIGTATTANSYEANIDGCLFIGIEKEFVFNGQTGGAITWGTHWIRNSRIRDRIPGNKTIWNPPSSYHLKLYSGTIDFAYCPVVRFTETTFYGETVLRFDNCFVCEFDGPINFTYTGEGIMTLNFEYSGFYYKWNIPLTIQNNAEFNLIHSYFFTTGTTINYNSAVQSRWVSVLQKVYNSTTTLGGTGLVRLHIFNSVFKFAEPTGLGTNFNNAYNSFIDY